jgi:two-component system sensor histidine kinase AtoS
MSSPYPAPGVVSATDTNRSPEPGVIGEKSAPQLRRIRQSKLRLVISIPALLVLITLSFGLVSYLLITSRWGVLEARGLDKVAAELVEAQLIAMIVMVLISAVGGLGIVYTVLRPIRAMEETARSIIEGRLDRRAPTLQSPDELGSLSRSFNSMIDFLHDCIEERNRYMVEGIMTGLLLVDLDGRIKALNSTGAQLLGLDSSWAIGRRIDQIPRNAAHPGQTFWSEVEKMLSTDLSCMNDETILNTSVGENSLIVAVSVICDAKKTPFSLMLNFRDAAEMHILSEHLVKADQLAALGTFTMGLAHELRNPLGSIKGMIQLLEMEVPRNGDAGEIIERVVREVNRLDRFVRELLDFSQEAPVPPEPVDLVDILRVSISQIKNQFKPETYGPFDFTDDLKPLPPVHGEPDRLVQAFSNILRNAFESARPGSEISVLADHRPAGQGHVIEIHIRNTGSTIKANDIDKIFDPFFTTRKGGTGLGLAIAYQILTQNGAQVDLDVGPDEVDFIIAFPVKTPDGWPSTPRTALSASLDPVVQEESSSL